jgi:4-hydroxy-tetrahydrodipicolinate synthase
MQALHGTGVAIITPFNADESVDHAALIRLLHHLMDGGVDYLVALGTTGETPVLSEQEQIEVLNTVYKTVGNRLPIVVGVGGNATANVIEKLNRLPLDPAVAILSASPYYNKPSQEGIFQHYKMLAAHAPKPILLYNVPGRTGRNMEAATTLRLAHEVSNIAGIKEASGSMSQCMQILKHRPEGFTVVSGDDDLVLPQIACGMDGVISVAANAFPKHFSTMVSHCLRHSFLDAKKINDDLMGACALMFEENNPAGIKAFLAELGIIHNQLRLPCTTINADLGNRIRAFVAQTSLS